LPATAQNIQINRENKTIYVSAEGEASADAEIVTLTLGYHSYGKTKDALYDEAAAVSENVVNALLEAGVKIEQIQTGTVSLTKLYQEPNWPEEWRASRVFEASLTWKIVVPVKQGEMVLAIAMKAGANYFGDPTWDVVDRTKLQAEAGRIALEKARTVADSMAAGLGAKLGALVYASNAAPVRLKEWPFTFSASSNASLAGTRGTTVPARVIRLFPEKITEKTTVYAVFAIE